MRIGNPQRLPERLPVRAWFSNNGQPEIPPDSPVEIPNEPLQPDIPPGGPLEEPATPPEPAPARPVEIPPAPGK